MAEEAVIIPFLFVNVQTRDGSEVFGQRHRKVESFFDIYLCHDYIQQQHTWLKAALLLTLLWKWFDSLQRTRAEASHHTRTVCCHLVTELTTGRDAPGDNWSIITASYVPSTAINLIINKVQFRLNHLISLSHYSKAISFTPTLDTKCVLIRS